MKAAVLGAGISGLTAARLLKEQGWEITVFEKNETAGGLARTRIKDGKVFDLHGGHVFNSKYPEVVDWVFSLLPKENWQYSVRNAKIYLNGRYISYPFELSLCELEAEDAVDCACDFILAQNGPEPDNFRDWLTWNFGAGIAEKYMLPYNEKIWAYPLEKMETQWMRGKMPLPGKKDILRSLIMKDPKERKMPHSTFYYPLHGGVQSLINAIAEGLTVRTGTPVLRLEKAERGWLVNGEGPFDQVISTIPLPELPKVMKLPETVSACAADLKYNSLTTVFFDCPPTDISWLYIPSHDYRSHRVCYESAMTPFATPLPNRGCAALELIGDRVAVDADFARRDDIIPEELGFEKALDTEFTEYAYVVHDRNYRKNLRTIFDYFSQDKTFSLLGRWGRWNYNNMDVCIHDAMELAEELRKP